MKMKNLFVGLTSGILGGIIVLGSYLLYENKTVHTENVAINSKTENLEAVPVSFNRQSGSLDFTEAAEKGTASVVHVKTSYNQPNYTLYDFIFGTQPRNYSQVSASGSGVIISSDGYVVTNNHVIENAEIIEVVLNNKKSYTGKVVGTDPSTDVALIKIDATDLPYLAYGNSDDLKIGEWVLAVGNPFNLTSTVTAGIVSAKARNIDAVSGNMAIESFIQTDAAVNPGNSGGALLNTSGELVGINTAIASQTGSYIGYSFAIPVNIVRKVVADLMGYGEVQRAYLGLNISDIDSEIAKKLNIDELEGVYVAGVNKNSAADEAGIKEGDVVTSINSISVNSSTELLEQISKYRPGESVSVTVKRGKNTYNLNAVLQNKYGSTEVVKSVSIDVLGAKFQPITNQEKNRLRINNGLKVTELSAGRFAAAGIAKNFVIVRVNHSAISSVSDLEKAIKSSNGVVLVEGIYPNGTTAYYAIKTD